AQKQAAVREAAARLRLLEAGARPEGGAAQRGRAGGARGRRDLAPEDLGPARQRPREGPGGLAEQITPCRAAQAAYPAVQTPAAQLLGQKAISTREYQEADKQAQVARSREQQAQALKRSRQTQGTQEAETELARREKELADAEAALRLLEAGPRPEEVEAEQ